MDVNGTVSAVGDHTLVRAFTPFVVAALIGFSAWIFNSVQSLQQQVTLISDGSIQHLEEKVDGLSVRIDAMNEILTDLRVSLGGRARAGLDH